GGDFRSGQHGGANQHDELVALVHAVSATEEIAQQRNILEKRNPGSTLGFGSLNQAAKDDGVAVADGDFGDGLLLAGDGHLTDVGEIDRAAGALDLLVDVHDHQAVGIDQGRDFERDADLELLDGRVAAERTAAIITALRIGPRFTHEYAG